MCESTSGGPSRATPARSWSPPWWSGPGNPPAKVDWLVSAETGGPKIVDVIAEGTSLRLTQRSDYSAYLAHNNNSVQALIDALRQQASQPG